MASVPPPPSLGTPSGDPALVHLHESVTEALYALPSFFQSPLHVDGVLAGDLFTFNASLGATIEQQVVDQLNRLRTTWDPDEMYPQYRFERQPQVFPDVILRTYAPGHTTAPVIGIELKGWYLLARERAPSFRFAVTPAVCTPFDILAVFPWALSNVVAGSPKIFDPFVIPAGYAAQYRNWHWEHAMESSHDKTITVSRVASAYPSKRDAISDVPTSDSGGNFGRFARTGLMDAYITALFQRPLVGIPLDAWQRFLKVFSEGAGIESVIRAIESAKPPSSDDDRLALREALAVLARVLG